LAGISVLLLGYRLAPEDPFPAALKDATEAFQWMQGTGPVGIEGCQTSFIGGDSAGGGLTLATLLSLGDRGEAMPTAAVTLSAWTDLALTGETLVANADTDPVVRSVDSIRPIAMRYLDGVDPKTPLASPLYGDPTGFPPLYMQVGEKEMLLSDTTRFAALARSRGVVVELDVVPEVPHFVQMFALEVPEGLAALERVSGFMLGFLARA
jgi:acetyl esterase/lipase